MKKKVLLGMSGGIDSSVSAMLLQEQGFEVVGITFLFGDLVEVNRKISEDAKGLADKLGIKHLTIDLRKEFKETVIRYFISEYLEGRTPFPCAYCNPRVKFYYLEKYSLEEKCEFISTGHYAEIKNFNGIKYIYQGTDVDKDQSFFLWGLSKKLIEKLVFPLGGFEKTEIRKFAGERGFERLSKRKDSLGICFIEGNDYRLFLEKEGIKTKPGYFVDAAGRVLGKHVGIPNYTIGQRRGLGINLNFPVFVEEIRLDANEIVLGKYNDLYKSKICLNNCYFVDSQEIKDDAEYVVKVRYRLQETPCKIHILEDNKAEVELLKPEAMISNGQTAVFYDGQRLLGGGFIESSE